MSHFSVIVCIEDPSKLEAVLAPYDENLDVEPYRDYEEGEAHDFWLISALRRAVDNLANGTGIRPYNPDGLGYSTECSRDTPEQQKAEMERDAALYLTLPDPITWREVVSVYNDYYKKDEGEQLFYEEETGRAYTMSTANPQGKWDYWRIGGRWGGYFTCTRDDERLFKPVRGWDSPNVIMADACDGGPKELLDLSGMRERAAEKARAEHEKWLAAVDGTPEALPWSSFADLISPDYDLDRARAEYKSQPRIQALEGTEFKDMWNCPIKTFQKPAAIYAEWARAQAIPGYAVVTLDGQWMAPGHMGWFGCSSDSESDRVGYYEVANAYIESVPDSAYLIAVDCHV